MLVPLPVASPTGTMDTRDPPDEPEPPPAGFGHVQPGDEQRSSDTAGLRAALDEVESLTAAQRLQRLAENDIVLRLQLTSFDPATDDWRELAGALIEYGYPIFMAWTVTGSVRGMAARHGGSGVWGIAKLPEMLKLPSEQAHDLVMDLLEVAVNRFRTRTLLASRWSAIGGASLTTFFIGRCLMELPDVYEQWNRKQLRTFGLRPDGAEIDDNRPGSNPAGLALTGVTIDAVFDGGPHTDDEVRAMFELQQLGFTLTEIADMLTSAGHPHTEGKVRTRMSRARADATRRLASNE